MGSTLWRSRMTRTGIRSLRTSKRKTRRGRCCGRLIFYARWDLGMQRFCTRTACSRRLEPSDIYLEFLDPPRVTLRDTANDLLYLIPLRTNHPPMPLEDPPAFPPLLLVSQY